MSKAKSDASRKEAVAVTSAPGRPCARVFLVDDHALLRKGVSAMIDTCDDFMVCGEAGSATEAMERIPVARPDIVVVDISLPGSGGIDVIRDIRLRHPAVRILVLSMHDEKLYAERALRAGAQGYVMKKAPPERLLEGLRAVIRGGIFVTDLLKEAMLETFLAPAPRGDSKLGVERLSNRELQVFEAIGFGQTTTQIAAQHRLSPKTVETYRSNIKRKLGLENGNRLIHAAVRWVESEAAGSEAGSP